MFKAHFLLRKKVLFCIVAPWRCVANVGHALKASTGNTARKEEEKKRNIQTIIYIDIVNYIIY